MKTTRRKFLVGSTALMAAPLTLSAVKISLRSQNRNFGSPLQPHAGWKLRRLENGRIGGVVYGGISGEQIALTESTCLSGAPSSQNVNPTALANLNRVRGLMFEEKYAEAGALCKEHLLGRRDSFGTNLPVATLRIDCAEESVTEYRRSLDLDEAIARVVSCRTGLSRVQRGVRFFPGPYGETSQEWMARYRTRSLS